MRIFLFLLPWMLLWGETVPRTVIALYDSKAETDIYYSRPHQLCEMPCNHLGLVFDYHDISKPLPNLENRDDVVGILAFLTSRTTLSYEEGLEYLTWATRSMDQGKKFVLMGHPFMLPEDLRQPLVSVNEFWGRLGARLTGEWTDVTYQLDLQKKQPSFLNFEMEYKKPYPPFPEVIAISDEVDSILTVPSTNGLTTLIGNSSKGGWILEGFGAYYLYERGRDFRKWYINPFLWFEEVFQTAGVPKPDTTTIAGRRIFYSHIDGDGWNNTTEDPEFPRGTIAQKAVLERIIKRYPQLPVTVAPIGADVDLNWVAREQSEDVAEETFALPHVEMASHTFTHPFAWAFFRDYLPQDEIPYLYLYPTGSWLGTGIFVKVRTWLDEEVGVYPIKGEIAEDGAMGKLRRAKTFDEVYDVPRAFALKPFDLNLEVNGSIDLINRFGHGKKVELFQWSGDCQPFPSAVELVMERQLPNINGGDSRFDANYPSYSWVAPLGRQVNKMWQVYASNANENVYTDLWTRNFFGFNLLPKTFENTEKPFRLRPMNLYYHSYSGQKIPSLKALEQNVEYVLKQEYCAIKASEFAQMVEGFYSSTIDRSENNAWTISNKGMLSTIRLDHAGNLGVNYSRSKGVIGHRTHQGSLYVYLDRNVPSTTVVFDEASPSEPYLVQGSWQVYNCQKGGGQISYTSHGYGLGEFEWWVPNDGVYTVSWNDRSYQVEAKNNRLIVQIDDSAIEPIAIKIQKS